jgi:hypothetical protein
METSQTVKTKRVCAQLIQLTKGYRIRRDLDNMVMNVLQAKLAYEVLVFLSRKQFCEAVNRHFSSRLPLNSDSSREYLLAKPHLVDINMAKLRLDAISITFNKAYSLRIVIPESLLGMKHEADVAAETIPVLRFNASSQESVQLCLSGRTSD